MLNPTRLSPGRVVVALLVLAGGLTGHEAVRHAVGAEEAKPAAKVLEWKSLFDGKTLKNWESSKFGGEGEVSVKDGMIVMQQGSEMTGITWTGGELPKIDYEISLQAQRIDGSDFFCGLTFPINDLPCRGAPKIAIGSPFFMTTALPAIPSATAALEVPTVSTFNLP